MFCILCEFECVRGYDANMVDADTEIIIERGKMYLRGVEYHYAISFITLSSSAFLTTLFAPLAEDPGFDSCLHKGGRGGGEGVLGRVLPVT